MSVASTALRHSRAAGLMAVALVVAGVIAASLAAEQHLPAARVPAHRHHRAQRHAAGAVDDADRHAADRAGGDGGAGHPPRALDDHPRRHGDLRAVRPGDRHGRRAAAGAEPRRRDPRRSAGGHRADGRAPDAGGLPDLHPEPDRPPADRRSERLRVLRHAAGAGARAGRRARSRCWRATRARSRSCSIRRKLDRRGPDGRATSPTRSRPQNQLAAGRPVRRSPASSTWCSPRACGRRSTTSPRRRSWSRTARPCASADVGHGRVPARPIARSLITGNGRDAVVDQHLAADRRQHPRRSSAASTQALAGAGEDAAGRPARSRRSTTSPSSSRPRSPTSATPS